MVNNKDDGKAVILKPGVAFTTWASDLRGIRPRIAPVPPPTIEPALYDAYIDQLEEWTMKDLQAYSIILRRLDPSIRPESNNTQTSLELYRMIADTHKPSAATPYRSSYTKLLNTEFISTATEYCNDFQRNLQNFRNAASNLEKMTSTSAQYGITDGMASIMFFEGTTHISWLETWRATGALDRDQHSYASLEQMMATFGIAKNVDQSENPNNKNKNFNRGHANAAADASMDDTTTPTLAMTVVPTKLSLIASASGLPITKDTIIWDSGASRHFINNRSVFTSLIKLDKPFTFDQAVDKSTLSYGGTACIKIGSLTPKLTEALFSPESSMNLISAGRAFRLANIQEDRKAGLLFHVTSSTRTPIARLIDISDISIVLPLPETASARSSVDLVALIIAKPAVAKLKKCSAADRWHQRLGHVGPLILSKTNGFAKGLDGLDTSELTHCVCYDENQLEGRQLSSSE
ncbi:hypothetical protein K3495_g12250 [Podosphaera aphanis]|nr:hypothetical protein K3495_g12250 [Podosphaera aphanis]